MGRTTGTAVRALRRRYSTSTGFPREKTFTNLEKAPSYALSLPLLSFGRQFSLSPSTALTAVSPLVLAQFSFTRTKTPDRGADVKEVTGARWVDSDRGGNT